MRFTLALREALARCLPIVPGTALVVDDGASGHPALVVGASRALVVPVPVRTHTRAKAPGAGLPFDYTVSAPTQQVTVVLEGHALVRGIEAERRGAYTAAQRAGLAPDDIEEFVLTHVRRVGARIVAPILPGVAGEELITRVLRGEFSAVSGSLAGKGFVPDPEHPEQMEVWGEGEEEDAPAAAAAAAADRAEILAAMLAFATEEAEEELDTLAAAGLPCGSARAAKAGDGGTRAVARPGSASGEGEETALAWAMAAARAVAWARAARGLGEPPMDVRWSPDHGRVPEASSWAQACRATLLLSADADMPIAMGMVMSKHLVAQHAAEVDGRTGAGDGRAQVPAFALARVMRGAEVSDLPHFFEQTADALCGALEEGLRVHALGRAWRGDVVPAGAASRATREDLWRRAQALVALVVACILGTGSDFVPTTTLLLPGLPFNFPVSALARATRTCVCAVAAAEGPAVLAPGHWLCRESSSVLAPPPAHQALTNAGPSAAAIGLVLSIASAARVVRGASYKKPFPPSRAGGPFEGRGNLPSTVEMETAGAFLAHLSRDGSTARIRPLSPPPKKQRKKSKKATRDEEEAARMRAAVPSQSSSDGDEDEDPGRWVGIYHMMGRAGTRRRAAKKKSKGTDPGLPLWVTQEPSDGDEGDDDDDDDDDDDGDNGGGAYNTNNNNGDDGGATRPMSPLPSGRRHSRSRKRKRAVEESDDSDEEDTVNRRVFAKRVLLARATNARNMPGRVQALRRVAGALEAGKDRVTAKGPKTIKEPELREVAKFMRGQAARIRAVTLQAHRIHSQPPQPFDWTERATQDGASLFGFEPLGPGLEAKRFRLAWPPRLACALPEDLAAAAAAMEAAAEATRRAE